MVKNQSFTSHTYLEHSFIAFILSTVLGTAGIGELVTLKPCSHVPCPICFFTGRTGLFCDEGEFICPYNTQIIALIA